MFGLGLVYYQTIGTVVTVLDQHIFGKYSHFCLFIAGRSERCIRIEKNINIGSASFIYDTSGWNVHCVIAERAEKDFNGFFV